MSWINPMSSIRSASSSTKTSISSNRMAFWPCKSRRRPGVATNTSTPPRNFCIWGLIFTPPNTTSLFSGKYFEYCVTLSWICAASSRVGVTMRARQRLGWARRPSLKRCRIGRVKPAVFPVPVCAAAMTSCPCITAGMDCAWMGVGVV